MATEIELHVGHFGNGTGAKSIVDEVQYARKFIKRIYEILQKNKVPSTYYEDTVSKNQNQNINNLIKYHNVDRNGLIVSGHLNASGGVKTESIGAEVLYFDQSTIAQNVVNAICNASGMKNRGIKQRTDLGVLARTFEHAILIEFGFVNSRKDVELMDKHFEEICLAVAEVLAKAIGHNITNTPQNSNKVTTSNVVSNKEESEIMLNDTGRKEAKELIKRGVKENLFTSKHENIDKYSDIELVSYAFAYLNRKVK